MEIRASALSWNPFRTFAYPVFTRNIPLLNIKVNNKMPKTKNSRILGILDGFLHKNSSQKIYNIYQVSYWYFADLKV